MKNLVSYFFTDYRFKTQSLWFKRSLYASVLIQLFYWLLYYPLYFGNASVVYQSSGSIGIVKDLAFLLYNSTANNTALYYLIFTGLLSVIALFQKKRFFIIDFIIWFLILNIHNRIYPTLTAGNFLLNQYLFFNCFISSSFKLKTNFFHSLKPLLHNFASLSIIIQLCLAYFLAALAKVGDYSWLNGTAIIAVQKINHFSLFKALHYDEGLNWLSILLNYLILYYQLLFPMLVWVKPLKKPLLIFGIVTHLYISFVMGLFMFGLIMIVGYVYFWPIKKQPS